MDETIGGPKRSGQLDQPRFHLLDDLIRRRGARRDADHLRAVKPSRTQIGRSLHVMHPAAMRAAGGDQFAGVVAVRPSNHHHHLGLARQFHRRALPLFGRLTDRVYKSHFRTGEPVPQKRHQAPDLVDRLRGLRRHTKPRTLPEFQHLLRREDDVAFRQILREPSNFHMITLTDDDGVKSPRHQTGHRPMGEMNQRTSGLKDFSTALLKPIQGGLRRPEL